MIKMINFTNVRGERQVITNVHTVRADYQHFAIYAFDVDGNYNTRHEIYTADSLEEANKIVDHIAYIAHENDGYVDLDIILDCIHENKEEKYSSNTNCCGECKNDCEGQKSGSDRQGINVKVVKINTPEEFGELLEDAVEEYRLI